MTTQTEWRPAAQLPPVKVGDMREYVLAVFRARSGKVYSFAASYLNAYRLEYRDGCPHEKCPFTPECDEGCPTTGWFVQTGDDAYDSLFQTLELRDGDKIKGWCDIPQWSDNNDEAVSK